MNKNAKKCQKPTPKNLGGRPKKEIDFSTLEGLCAIHCTQSEICSFFSVNSDTLSTRIKEEYGIGFSEFYREFSEQGKISLRRMQWNSAKNNIVMQKWLGANILGQKSEPSESKTNNGRVANVIYNIKTNTSEN